MGRRLSNHLRQSKERIKAMLKATTSTLISNHNNNTSNTTTNTSTNTTNTSTTTTTSLDPFKEKSKEKIKTYQIKKTALRKSLTIQYGLTACMIFQFFGFIFIPASLGWIYLMNFFHFCYNIGLVGFIVLILCIYNPMRQVQRLFRQDSDPKAMAVMMNSSQTCSSSLSGSTSLNHRSSGSAAAVGSSISSKHASKMFDSHFTLQGKNELNVVAGWELNDSSTSNISTCSYSNQKEVDLEMNGTVSSSPSENTSGNTLTSPATTVVVVGDSQIV